MRTRRKRSEKCIGEILIESRVINREHLDRALEIQQDRRDRNENVLSGSVLVELGLAKEEDILQAINTQYRFPYLPVDNYEIDHHVIDMIPAELALKHIVIPIDRLANTLTVAMSNPLDNEAIEKIEALCQCNVQVFITTSSEILRAIGRYYKGADSFAKLMHDYS